MAEPLLVHPDYELWLAALPASSAIDIRTVLPAFPRPAIASLKLLIFLQRTEVDFMRELRADIAKDHHLTQFFALSEEIQTILAPAWFDYFDPGSGLPMLSQGGPSVWSDVDTLQMCLKMETVAVGGCQVVRHREWGFRCYPGVMITTADWEDIRKAGRVIRDSWRGGGEGVEGKTQKQLEIGGGNQIAET